MKKYNKNKLYESIMKDVSKIVKKHLLETLADEIRKEKENKKEKLDNKSKNELISYIKEIYKDNPDKDNAFGLIFEDRSDMELCSFKNDFYYIAIPLKFEQSVIDCIYDEDFRIQRMKNHSYKVFLYK